MAGRNDLKIYDDAAANWWSDDIRWVRILKNMVPGRLKWFDRHMSWEGKRVLDLGCAGGFMAEALARRGARVTGLDPAGQAIEAARSHAAAEGLDIRYDIGTGEEMSYADASFDAVVCVDVLEHVRDLTAVLAQVSRVLVADGRFLFDTINRNPLSRLAAITVAEDLLRVLPKGTHDPDMFITPDELAAALEAANLTPRRWSGLGPVGLNRRGDPVFGPIPLRTVIYMGVADKTAP
ncbi:bifunctional 2-polyprenyl-6-hydroxyphenol methylase/3-demethylubiquinol 3-O-methyltransferase UbiG [Palleronia rufa]|uniref:bifunctional 2-polyprenyl-6-hydroxyphenol methylase/3-demethylubiquinol 3-O-methyltransferase UbiG n=1 Tax=Palleronia rufa TaxID=1530186 RepID=UPI00055E44E1|nr:bifunctional 2-polyprenyl-6-hydroxyphenol methylase/3-demethylubiquinol 3-O-methyltransferase UbiG [Palleronia rufa]